MISRLAPVRSHACRSAIALLMYSVRAVRMRWPALSGIDANATFQAAVALCTSAISSGCAWISRATEPYTSATRASDSVSAS